MQLLRAELQRFDGPSEATEALKGLLREQGALRTYGEFKAAYDLANEPRLKAEAQAEAERESTFKWEVDEWRAKRALRLKAKREKESAEAQKRLEERTS